MKKYIAPAVVAGCLLLYYIGIAALFVHTLEISWWGRLLLCVIPLLLGGVVIFVLVQRIHEIRSDETDDLDRY